MERIRELRAGGLTLQAIADELNTDDVETPTGAGKWHPNSVRRAIAYA